MTVTTSIWATSLRTSSSRYVRAALLLMPNMLLRIMTMSPTSMGQRLTELFADISVVADLQSLGAHVALMLSDLSDERAAVVRRLNAADIPVIAIPLLPAEDG